MPLRPKNPHVYERILAFGSWDTGKTRAWLSIARLAQVSGSDAQFYVIDSDNDAVPRMLSGETFSMLRNVHIFPVMTWEDFVDAAEKINAITLRPNDWIVIDMIDKAWSAVQEYFVEQVWGQEIGDYFLQARKNMREDAKAIAWMEGRTDWPVIKKLYTTWLNKVVVRPRCHVYAATAVETIRDSDDKAVKQMAAAAGGLRPAGEKRLPHYFHTVVLFQKLNETTRSILTVKDRKRERLMGVQLTDFAAQYLLGPAGWTLQ